MKRLGAAWSSPLALLLILLGAFAIYAPTIGDWFTGDDFWFLHSARSFSLHTYAVKSFDFRQTGSLPEFDRYRPLYPLLWWGMFWVFGLHAWAYHTALVLLHLAATTLVWFVARRILNTVVLANAAAAIFAFHPGYSDAIAWISGGNRVVVTVPYLAAFLLFMKYGDHGTRWLLYYVGSLLCFVVAVLLHSAALTLVGVLPSYALLVRGQPSDSLRARWWLPFAPFIAVAAVSMGIQIWVRSHLHLTDAFSFGWFQYTVYAQYLGHALFPALPLASGRLGGLLQLIEGLASVIMISLTVILLNQRPRSVGVFLVIWFYLALLPDTTLSFLGAIGRALYLPGTALAMFLALSVLTVLADLPHRVQRAAYAAAPVLCLVIVLPVGLVTYYHTRAPGQDSRENKRLVSELQAELPNLPAGGTLYVIDAPINLIRLGGNTRLNDLVNIYYSDVDVQGIMQDQLPVIEGALRKDDRIFRFER